MKDILILESVRERDIDLLLIEEFSVNVDFVNFFLSKLYNKNIIVNEMIAYHSVTDSEFGESDMILSYKINQQQRFLLIENKIGANAQKQQALRYLKRAERLSKKYNCKADTCIVAPQNYLTNNIEAKKYKNRLSYEDLYSYFYQKNTLRDNYKANVIQLAIDQERRGYTAIKDDFVTEFWHKYWELLQQKIPNAIMKEPLSIPANSDWAIIKFRNLPKGCFIYHKFAKGYVDLQTNFNEEEVRSFCQSYNNQDMQVVKTGKSYSIRIQVEPIDRCSDIHNQLKAIGKAFSAIKIFAYLN